METKQLSKATSTLVKSNGIVKVHTLVSPADMFANATHIIELPTQLILIDGHFFAQFAKEFRDLADSLQKPITRFYVTHDHPDHYLGFGDAFPEVEVYALKETKDAIEKNGAEELSEKQELFGDAIAKQLNYPKIEVIPGIEIIDGVSFIFNKIENAESPIALSIQLPDLGVLIAQDIVYNNIHLFITGDTDGWKNALTQILDTQGYDTILAGHGNPTDKNGVQKTLDYLTKVDEILRHVNTAEEYKTTILSAFPNHSGVALIDIYLPYLFQSK